MGMGKHNIDPWESQKIAEFIDWYCEREGNEENRRSIKTAWDFYRAMYEVPIEREEISPRYLKDVV